MTHLAPMLSVLILHQNKCLASNSISPKETSMEKWRYYGSTRPLHQPFQNQNPRRFDFRFSTFNYCLFSFLFRATSILYSSQRQPRHADHGATWFPTRPILPSTRTWTDEIRRPRHGYGHGHGWRAYVSRRKWITGGGCGGGVGGYSGQVRRSGLQLRVG